MSDMSFTYPKTFTKESNPEKLEQQLKNKKTGWKPSLCKNIVSTEYR